MDIGKLPPSIRTDPEQAKTLNSSLDSISSGIQAATQTSGPAEVSDWLDKYSASFPATASPLTARSFADSAAISSPSSYLNSARQLGGENAVKSFSSLVQMDKVAIKLGDPSFKQQKHLEGFSNALANLKFDTGIAQAKPGESSGRERVADESKAAIPFVGNVADESSIKLRIADESSIKLRVADESKAAIPFMNAPDESSIKLRVADESKAAIPFMNAPDESSIKLRVADESKAAVPFMNAPDESSIKLRIADESSIKLRIADESKAMVPIAGDAPAQAMFLGDIKDSSAVATLSADNADSMIQDANVFQRLSNFQSTLNQIVSLNRGLEGK